MGFEPDKITADHVRKAVAKIKAKGIDLIPSTRWNVLINNEPFPPKELMRHAHEQLNGEFLWHHGGGDRTNRFFEKMGFSVVEKDNFSDPVKALIVKYKKYLKDTQLSKEVYKWKLVKQFKGRPDVNAPDFFEEIKAIDYRNLIYPVGISVIHHIAKDRAEPYRKCFKVLFDESAPLPDRLSYFNAETLKIYRELVPEKKFSHHQDERTMATFLAFFDSDKYAFYKDSFYQKYCNLLDIKAKKVGEKYPHYLGLINSFISDYIEPDAELLKMVNDLLPADAFPDSNHKVLAQDILYRMLDKGIDEINIGNSSVYKISMGDISDREIEDCISQGKILVYSDTKSKGISKLSQGDTFADKIQVGDYFYLTPGNRQAFNLIGKITGDAVKATYKNYGERDWLERSFESIVLPKKKGKYTGARKWWTPNDNSTCTKIKEDELDKANELLFEPFFQAKLIVSELEIPEDENKDSGFTNNKKTMEPLNQILFGPPGTGKTYNSVTKALNILGEDLNGLTRKQIKQRFDEKLNDGQIVFTTFHQSMSYEDFIEGIKPQKPEDGDTFIKYDIEPGIFKNICNKAKAIEQVHTIVDWDSPTYYKMSLGGKERSDIHEWCIDNNVIALGWGGVSDLKNYEAFTNWNDYRDAFIKEFPDLVSESRFHIQAAYTFQNMKENDVVVVSKGNHIIDAIGLIKGAYYWDDKNPIDFFHFRNVEWIAKNLNTSPDRFFKKKISQMAIYEFSDLDVKREAFKELTAINQKVIEKPHVLIIDEINRGNVSQIFGELITLIEEDKRIGRKEQLEITLPYSKEKFGVPASLYIVGTMNTADRSVEALDTALRRRFSFVEMPPNYELPELNTVVEGFKLSEILQKINVRIGKLLGKDNLIGHSYLLEVKDSDGLRSVFQNKIIPLLQEYFYGDFGKIGLIIGNGFFDDREPDNNKLFAKFRNYEASDLAEREVYVLYNVMDKDQISDPGFKAALELMMG